MDTKTVTPEELSISNMWQLDALYRLLLRKGIITEKEFIDEYDKENKK